MLIIPAIDLKDGQCVRLKQGLMEQATVFSDSPAEQARHWLEQGARRLHLVDLNGAFAGKPKNAAAIKEVARSLPLDRLLVETDAPYLAPVPYRGKTNHPGLVRYVAEEIARLRQVEFETIASATTRNFFALFTRAQISNVLA